MFSRTRGFESPSPRHPLPRPPQLDLIVRAPRRARGMARRKSQKIIRTRPRNVTTGMCRECKTIGRIQILGPPGEERAKCPSCNKEFDL